MARVLLSFVLATAIGGVFLWLALHDVGLERIVAFYEQVGWRHLAVWSLVYVAIYVVCHGARVVRWYDLVRPVAPDVSPGLVHRVCVVGFAAILMLPLRLGEFVRPYLLSRRAEVPASAALGTAVVERVMDGLIMTGLLFVTLATYRGEAATGFAVGVASISAAIFVGALTVCLLAMWSKAWTVTLVRRIFGVVSRGLADKLAGLLEGFIDGFRALIAGRALGRFLGLTVLYWGTNVASMWVLARYGFGFEIGPWDMATVLPLLVIGLMIPGGPAMAGNFELFLIRGLGLFLVLDGPGKAAAGVFAALVHVLQLVVIVVPALAVMWSDRDSRDLVTLATSRPEASAQE